MTEEILERNFRVPTPARLVVENIRGSLQVLPGEIGQISVKAVKHLASGDARRTQIQISQDGDGALRVKTHYREMGWFFFSSRRPCKVDYTIYVPPATHIHAAGVSSSASLQGIEGQVQVTTVSGPQFLRGLSGSLKLSTVSGQIQAEDLAGQLHLETVSGHANFENCDFLDLRVTTVSGDLAIETPLTTGPYHFKSVSGNVSLAVPPGTGCTLRTTSLSGRFKTSLPISSSRTQGRERAVEVHGGGAQLEFSSISADLILTQQGSETAEQAQHGAAQARPDSASRRHLLGRIARGEISAEEGLRELT